MDAGGGGGAAQGVLSAWLHLRLWLRPESPVI